MIDEWLAVGVGAKGRGHEAVDTGIQGLLFNVAGHQLDGVVAFCKGLTQYAAGVIVADEAGVANAVGSLTSDGN